MQRLVFIEDIGYMDSNAGHNLMACVRMMDMYEKSEMCDSHYELKN